MTTGSGQTGAEPASGDRLPWATDTPVLPLGDLRGALGARIAQLGARQINLYRSMAAAPELLEAWVDFAWALRRDCVTPRALRELMILRTAVVMRSEYEWHQHRIMAAEAGVTAERVEGLAAWQAADLYDDRERAALALTDAMLAGSVPDAVHEVLARHFTERERVELVLTAGFYAMVPRVLDALRVPVETPEPTGAA
jgi:4-carboxymuconolactone decarboxylase